MPGHSCKSWPLSIHVTHPAKEDNTFGAGHVPDEGRKGDESCRCTEVGDRHIPTSRKFMLSRECAYCGREHTTGLHIAHRERVTLILRT